MGSRQNPRIAFTGASGTGKTTLARYVEKTWGLPYEEYGGLSTARHVALQMVGEPNPYKTLEAGRYHEFQWRVQETKREWEEAHKDIGFITDRTHVDSLAYGCMHDPDGIGSDEPYFDATVAYTNDYDIIFYLDPRYGLYLNDSIRKQARAYHLNYDIFIRGFISTHVKVPKVVKLYSKDLEYKYQQIDFAISNWKRQ